MSNSQIWEHGHIWACRHFFIVNENTFLNLMPEGFWVVIVHLYFPFRYSVKSVPFTSRTKFLRFPPSTLLKTQPCGMICTAYNLSRSQPCTTTYLPKLPQFWMESNHLSHSTLSPRVCLKKNWTCGLHLNALQCGCAFRSYNQSAPASSLAAVKGTKRTVSYSHKSFALSVERQSSLSTALLANFLKIWNSGADFPWYFP